MPISSELKRVLKNDGTFILNIKERTEDGERQTYVLELILEMRKQDWLWTNIACLDLNRHYIGIESMNSYYKLAHESIEKWKAANNGNSGQMTLWT